MNYDAVIIGGGPAGAGTAIPLARRGWNVVVVEKTEFPRGKVCGEFMSATNLALLDQLGVGNAWREHAGPEVRRVGFFAGETCVEAPMPGARRGTFGRALGRDVLDTVILDKARSVGATVLQPWRAVAIHREGDVQAVRIETKGRDAVLRAPVVVAAHGSWEAGKLPSQLGKINRPSDLIGFKAHFKGGALPTDLMPLIAFPGGYGGMVWSDHGRLSISCCIRRDALAAIRKTSGNVAAAEALHQHVLASCRGAREAIGSASLDGHWLAAGPIRPGIRGRYEHDIFRVGNAAGESQPIIAEGITMAIQSGWLLASELVLVTARDRTAREIAGARYSRAWSQLFALRVHAADAFAQAALNPPGRMMMHALIRFAPRILTIGAELSGKTKPVPGLS
jgi:flavin-dependent dehydrogenase